MPKLSAASWLVLVLLVAAAASALDLRRVEQNTVVIYTTPALKDVMEKLIAPGFQGETGVKVKVIYLSAGDEYYRVRMASDHPEADLFLHASPLFLEKGYSDGLFDTFAPPEPAATPQTPQRRGADHGAVWVAFATSPLVEVYRPSLGAPPDLNHTATSFGFPHPLLSNNGIYATLLFESTNRVAGQKALDRTKVQPSNAQANINGAADGTFDATLGYEAVAKLYRDDKGARVDYAFPVLDGRRVTTQVLFSVGLVHNHPHQAALDFIAFLLGPDVQPELPSYYLRPTVPAASGNATVAGGLDLADAHLVSYDWARWSQLEAKLRDYVVQP